MLECKNENIVKLYEHKDEQIKVNEWVFFIMEYCSNGNLGHFMKDRVVSIPDRLIFMKDVISAVQYLHGEGIVHRDIKPGNILLRHSGRCVLADFGLARDFPKSAESLTMTGVGTEDWMAPEVLQKRYGLSADIFSLGLVILAIIRHQQGQSLEVHKEDGKPLYHWMDATRPPISLDDANDDSVTRAVKALVLQMIRFLPSARPKIQRVDEGIQDIIDNILVEKLPGLQLGFDAHDLVGMSKSGHILLEENHSPNKLHMYLLQEDGRFVEQWTRPRPQLVSGYCRKYFCGSSDDQSILLQDIDYSATHRYTDSLQHVAEWSQEGKLIQCLPPSRPVYGVEKERGQVERGWEYALTVLEEDGRRTTLALPSEDNCCDRLSVRGDTSGRIAVLDAPPAAGYYTLTTFQPGKQQPVRTRHEYRAMEDNAVCCWEDWLFVASRAPSVHIHNWSGDHIQELTTEQLQLSDSDAIWAMEVSGRRLMAAVGTWATADVSSLHVCQLSYNAPADETQADETQADETQADETQVDEEGAHMDTQHEPHPILVALRCHPCPNHDIPAVILRAMLLRAVILCAVILHAMILCAVILHAVILRTMFLHAVFLCAMFLCAESLRAMLLCAMLLRAVFLRAVFLYTMLLRAVILCAMFLCAMILRAVILHAVFLCALLPRAVILCAVFLHAVILRAVTLRAVFLCAVLLRAGFLYAGFVCAVFLRVVFLYAMLLRAVILCAVFLCAMLLRAVILCAVFLHAMILRAVILHAVFLCAVLLRAGFLYAGFVCAVFLRAVFLYAMLLRAVILRAMFLRAVFLCAMFLCAVLGPLPWSPAMVTSAIHPSSSAHLSCSAHLGAHY